MAQATQAEGTGLEPEHVFPTNSLGDDVRWGVLGTDTTRAVRMPSFLADLILSADADVLRILTVWPKLQPEGRAELLNALQRAEMDRAASAAIGATAIDGGQS